MDLHLLLKSYSCDCQNEIFYKIKTFLAKSLSELYEPALPNVIMHPLYGYVSLSLFFSILVAPNE